MAAIHRNVLTAIAGLSIALAAVSLGTPVHAQTRQFELAALADNSLVLFRSGTPQRTQLVKITGVDGTVIGIDVRPEDNKLYAMTDSSTLYTLDPKSGAATRVSRLGTPFRGGVLSGFDFNPQADRLRLVATTGQNLRINALVGAVAIDGTLAFAPDDRHAGDKPSAVAAGYTNSVAAAKSTVLFLIDQDQDILVKQDPPNDGVLTTVGRLGIDCGPNTGFDIATDSGKDHAFVVCGSVLHTLDLKTGAARAVGPIQSTDPALGKAGYVGLAVIGIAQ